MELFEHNPDESRRFFAFDMFGTLVRSRQSDLGDLFRVFYGFFPGQTPERVQEEYERFYTGFELTHEPNSEYTISMLMDHLNSIFGTDVDSLDAEERMMRGTKMFLTIDGVKDTLGYFKERGYRIGVLSNTTYRTSVVRGVLEDNGISDLVDTVVTSAEIGYKKPDPRAYDAVLRSLGANRSDCFFAGDSRANDYCGPYGFGMRKVFLIDPCGDCGRRTTVSSISEIPSLFRD